MDPKAKIDTSADVINQFTGEKWYYTDIVKDHFFNPQNLMLEDPDETQYQAIGMVGSPACLLPSTQIRKNPIVETVQNSSVGEKVLSHDGYFYQIEKIFRPIHNSTIIGLKNQLGELFATPDHLIFGVQVPRKKQSPFVHAKYKKLIPTSWVHAGDLQQGDLVLYPIPQEVRPLRSIKIDRPERGQRDFKSVYLPREIVITGDLLELFGYFVAEGHTKGKNETGFTFSIKEMVYVRRVSELIKKYFGLTTSIQERPAQHRIDVVCYNIYLARIFKELFGGSAAGKKAPEFLLFLKPQLQQSFLKGLWRGDGYFSSQRNQPRAGFTTISETLLHQVIWLLLRQRIVPSLYKEKAHIKKGISHQPSYRIHVGDMDSLERLAQILEISFQRNPQKRHAVESWFDSQYLYMPIRKVLRKKFSGRLFNFEVGQSHTYTTDAFLVHNCGDMMKMWLKIEPGSEKITEMKWRTFGCGSAIAATSMFSVMVTENGGVAIADALKIKPQHIMERLGGLPNRKIHCSVLADKAFRKAANDYFRRTGQVGRVIIEGARVVDPKLNITDKDIEEAVLEGATDIDSVQKKLKVGVGTPEIITEVEQLIRFYKEKYYG